MSSFSTEYTLIIRNRKVYLALILSVLISGLASRKYSHLLPQFIADYSGDTLWALMVFFITGFVFTKPSTLQIGITALIFSFAIEFSQLYRADWINYIRSFKIGGLVFGYGFLWSDLICYAVGIMTGILIEKFLIQN